MSEQLPVSFESVPCGFCGGEDAALLLSGPDRLLGLPGVFRVVRCVRCGLLRQDPRPTVESIDAYYPRGYDPYSTAIDDEPSALKRLDRRYGMWKRRRAIERILPEGRLLDVGCATGNFLHEMTRSGRWEVAGVEPGREAAAYARERLGLTVHLGRLAEVDLAPSSFDVVTMWNVLEHLHDPLGGLRAVQRLLVPGGLFVFSIPNLEGLEARLFGRYWLGWELPRHLYFFPRSVIGKMLAEAGLVVLRWRCLVGAYPAFLLTLRFALEGMVGRSRAVRLVAGGAQSMPARLLAAPAFWMLTTARQASVITGFARRKAA